MLTKRLRREQPTQKSQILCNQMWRGQLKNQVFFLTCIRSQSMLKILNDSTESIFHYAPKTFRLELFFFPSSASVPKSHYVWSWVHSFWPNPFVRQNERKNCCTGYFFLVEILMLILKVGSKNWSWMNLILFFNFFFGF